MSGILSDLGQLHFLQARRNGNVKGVVDPLKLKRRERINNTLLQRKTANFSHIKEHAVEMKSAHGDKKSTCSRPAGLRSQTWVINLGEWGFERWRHLTGREGQKERCYPVTVSQLTDPSLLKPGLCEGLKVRRSHSSLLPPRQSFSNLPVV